jgi:DNA replication protein DnaC
VGKSKSQNTTTSSDPLDVPVESEVSKEEILNMQLEGAGIPKKYRRTSWDNFHFDQPAIVKTDPGRKLSMRLERFEIWRGREDEGVLVFLTGRPGCGKTHLACATLRRWIESGRRDARFIVTGEFLSEMKQGFNDGTAAGVMRRAQSAKLLVLDDLGSEMATDWVRDTMYMLVNYRLNHLKPTVITSNLLLGEIAETYHARLASRLAGEFAIDMNLLPDYRLVKS